MEHIGDAYEKAGVVIARFQTPALHTGHKFLLDWVFARHSTLCIILASKDTVPTEKDPLTFAARRDMVLESYPHAIVVETFDCPSDKVWSKKIDELVSKTCKKGAVLYGSRDSFIPYYSGIYEVFEVPPVPSQSGTELRGECLKEGTCTMSYRIGMIASASERFPIVFPTVDCAPWKKEDGTYYVLLGHKEHDEDKYRFIGGFASKNDASFEDAAVREFDEETGGKITHKKPTYIASCSVSDYRYKNTKEGVMTAFFGIKYKSGQGIATDDINGLKWVALHELQDIIIPEHKILAEKLISYLNNKQSFFKKFISFFTSKNQTK